tara:strand:- start:367 stop:1395 length:1029 start_codon:yes stop_codon:yes gene_type:complete
MKNFFKSIIYFCAAILFSFSVILANSFADIDDIKNNIDNLLIGTSIPNIKTVNGLGTAIDLQDFTFVSHGDDKSQKIDFLTPSISGKFYNEFNNIGIELSIMDGSDTSSAILDGTDGAANYLDVIPVSGEASPGAYVTSAISTLSVKQQINSFNLIPFKKLELSSIPENLSFLIGFMINRTKYSIDVTEGNNKYTLNEDVTSKSIGPVISMFKEREINNSNNTKLVFGSKVALLYTEQKLKAANSRPAGSNNYSASDTDSRLAGMVNFSGGFVKKGEQEGKGNLFILGSVNIRNDVSSIQNPRCSAGQDCNSASYAASAVPAHLKKEISISPSLLIGYKKHF